jgi:N-acetylmuramoyl-L-alanine amidase
MALSSRPVAPAPVARPTPLPTRVAGARARAGSTTGGADQTSLVFLDPGHGGVDFGASGHTRAGAPVAEKNLTLAIALNVARRLRQDGISVALSRTDDSLPGATPADYTADGTMLTPDGVLADLQRRIDRANASGALVLLSIHFNAYSDPAIGGSETFYDAARPFAAQNERFAGLVQSSLIDALRAAGYATPDRGITDDSTLQAESLGALQGSYNHLVLLGPAVPGRLRPSQMPGALSEPMFVSNPEEATALVTPEMQDLLAGAYVKAIESYLREAPPQ